MDSEFDLRVYIAILKRRYLYLLVPAILIAIGALTYAYIMPPVYEASATILVESQQIPTGLAAPTVTANASERIALIEQLLLARDNLLQIANKYGLYQSSGQNRTPSAVVDSMRQGIHIDQIDTANMGQSGTGVIGFTVKFQYNDASVAAGVTNELVTSILSQNVQSRLSRASETSSFFQQQKDDLQKQLQALEDKIADYKRTNEADLPETLNSRREQLQEVQQQISDLDQKIKIVSDPGSALNIDKPTVQQLTYQLQAKQIELNSLNDQRNQIAPLAKSGVVPTNQLRDLDRDIAISQVNIQALKAQIAAAGGATGSDDQVAQLKGLRADLQKQAASLNDSISNTPAVQAQLNQMNGDYANLQVEYQQAQSKLLDAQTGERLEQDRQAERFEVIEQAVVPDTPKSPDRPKVAVAGIAGGVAVGVGLIVLRQSLDHAIYTAADLEKGLQLRPIATIPYIVTPSQRRRRKQLLIALVALVVCAIVAALVAIDVYYLPLDLVAQRLWERLQGGLAQRGLAR